MATQTDQTGGKRTCGSAGSSQIIRNQALDRCATGVVIAEGGVELLLVARVAKAKGQIERIGNVHDIVREQRPVGAILEIAIVGRTQIV